MEQQCISSYTCNNQAGVFRACVPGALEANGASCNDGVGAAEGDTCQEGLCIGQGDPSFHLHRAAFSQSAADTTEVALVVHDGYLENCLVSQPLSSH